MLGRKRQKLNPPTSPTPETAPPSDNPNNISHRDTYSDYNKVIRDASNAISRMFKKDYVELLDKRAHAKAMTSQFASAVKDALEMIKYASRSIQGYLRAGEFYAMQGKQAEAAAIYAKGLAKVSKNDPHYDKLVQGERTARLRKDQRIDMIARIPLETAFNVFERLPVTSKGACLCVSKVWRARLIKCATAWNSLTATGGPEDMAVCHAIPSTGKYVKTLTLACANKRLRSLYLNHMKMGLFSQISHLTLTKEMTYTVNRELTGIGLWQMRNTLTRLDVDYTDSHIMLSLSAILVSAPNLIWLSYKMNESFRRAVGDTTALIEPHPLKQLRLETQLTRGEEIAPILSNCKQLRTLALLNCEPQVLDTVYTCCPQIECFGYNTDAHITELSQEHAERPESTGLQLLEIGTAVHVELVLPFFTRHCDTLRSAYVRLDDLEEEWTLPDTWTQPSMKELRTFVCFFAEGTEPIIARLLSDCPELHNVFLEEIQDMDVIMRELVKADKLAKLYFGSIDNEIENGLQRLFDKHVLLGADSQLTHVRFYNTYTLTDSIIDGLRCLKNLNKLEICQSSGMSYKALATLFWDVKTLTEVKFQRVTAVNDQVVLSLGSVRTVRLISLGSVSDGAIRRLIDNSKSLRVLEVRNCPNCTKETLQLARGKKIKIMELPDRSASKKRVLGRAVPTVIVPF